MFPPNANIVEEEVSSEKHARLHVSGLTPALEVIAVLRKCDQCGERKPLEHFLLHSGGAVDRILRDVKVYAACRAEALRVIYNARRWPSRRRTPRRLGRYIDLPLNDWAERQSA